MSPKANWAAGGALLVAFFGVGIVFFARTGSPFDAVAKREDMRKHDLVIDLLGQAMRHHKKNGMFPKTLSSNGHDDDEKLSNAVVYRKVTNHEIEFTTTFKFSSKELEGWASARVIDLPFPRGKHTFKFNQHSPVPVQNYREW